VVSDLRMNDPEAEQQIVSGVFQLENSAWRWTSQTAVILLKPPVEATPLVIRFYIPDPAPARQVTLRLNNQVVATKMYASPGSYIIVTPALKPEGDSVPVSIEIDKTFSTQSDRRKLGIILTEVGFTQP